MRRNRKPPTTASVARIAPWRPKDLRSCARRRTSGGGVSDPRPWGSLGIESWRERGRGLGKRFAPGARTRQGFLRSEPLRDELVVGAVGLHRCEGGVHL